MDEGASLGSDGKKGNEEGENAWAPKEILRPKKNKENTAT